MCEKECFLAETGTGEDVEKLLIKEPTSDSTDSFSKAAVLTQLAQKHMTDSQTLYAIKAQLHFLIAGTFNTPLPGVCMEISPLRGDIPQGHSSRLSKTDLPIAIDMGNINLYLIIIKLVLKLLI